MDAHTIVTPRAEAYAEACTSAESELLHRITRWTHLHMAYPHMLSGAYQGQLLTLIAAILHPHTAIEVGAFVGYSTICLAQGMPQGSVLHTVEANDEIESQLRSNLVEAGVDGRVEVHIGSALQVVPALDEVFDLAFIDADKRNTQVYYDLLLPKMRRGGVVLVDNVLWGGKVLLDEATYDTDTRLMDAFNRYVQQDSRVENILLTLRDGLMLCRVL